MSGNLTINLATAMPGAFVRDADAFGKTILNNRTKAFSIQNNLVSLKHEHYTARISEGYMIKRIILAVVAVFVAWSVLDFVIHGLLLMQAYKDSASLWRPMEQMKFGLMHAVVLVTAIVFVCLYKFFVANKSKATGLKFGLLFGFGTGLSMGFGTYSVQPIPEIIACVWFVGTMVETAVAGWLTGLIIKE